MVLLTTLIGNDLYCFITIGSDEWHIYSEVSCPHMDSSINRCSFSDDCWRIWSSESMVHVVDVVSFVGSSFGGKSSSRGSVSKWVSSSTHGCDTAGLSQGGSADRHNGSSFEGSSAGGVLWHTSWLLALSSFCVCWGWNISRFNFLPCSSVNVFSLKLKRVERSIVVGDEGPALETVLDGPLLYQGGRSERCRKGSDEDERILWGK